MSTMRGSVCKVGGTVFELLGVEFFGGAGSGGYLGCWRREIGGGERASEWEEAGFCEDIDNSAV